MAKHKSQPVRHTSSRARRFPFGAEVIDGRIDFRIWAPDHQRAELAIEHPRLQPIPMTADRGFFSATIPAPGEAVLYRFRLDGNDALLPDPASRFQPEGPHGPSEVIDPGRFAWTDRDWPGISLPGRIIYELHVGTFTPEGTWLSATRELAELAKIGIGLIQMMPIADFAGRFGWGYDGVNLFAPCRLYGRPDDLRTFINAAHELGIGVLLDVVYNHLGPEGNHLKDFAGGYFTDRYTCEWGDAINFDGPDSRPVRDFFIANACYWVEEFHFDGFRLDATQQIFDTSDPGIITEITRDARQAAEPRSIAVLAENEPQRTELLVSRDRGGSGLDALWNDDFHHSLHVALTGRREAYYNDHRGSPQEFISVARHGFLYQGQRSRWQNNPRGTPSFGFPHSSFVCYAENHDQVANSAWGSRLGQLTSPGKHRAATALLLIGPWTPMIFQGQEFAASTPFLYFADPSDETSALISEGRKKFLSQFPTLATAAMQQVLAEPSAPETFQRCKLDLGQRREHQPFYEMFRDLANLRKADEVFAQHDHGRVEGAVLSDTAFVLRFFGTDADRLLVINFGADLFFTPAPEPLLAPPPGRSWRILLSTEDPRYGGGGTADAELDQGWLIPAEAAIVLATECDPTATRKPPL